MRHSILVIMLVATMGTAHAQISSPGPIDDDVTGSTVGTPVEGELGSPVDSATNSAINSTIPPTTADGANSQPPAQPDIWSPGLQPLSDAAAWQHRTRPRLRAYIPHRQFKLSIPRSDRAKPRLQARIPCRSIRIGFARGMEANVCGGDMYAVTIQFLIDDADAILVATSVAFRSPRRCTALQLSRCSFFTSMRACATRSAAACSSDDSRFYWGGLEPTAHVTRAPPFQ